MGMAFFLPTKKFTFARDGRQPEIFEPGVDENGEPHIFEFQEHQAVRLQQRGVGLIVDRRANYAPTDPAMKEMFDRHMADIGAHFVESPVISPGPTVRMSTAPALAVAAEVTQPSADEGGQHPGQDGHDQSEAETAAADADGETATESASGVSEEAPAAPAPTGRRRKRN